MIFKILINMETEKIDVRQIDNHKSPTVENIGWIKGYDKQLLLTMIRKEAFSFDDSEYEIFYDNLSGEMELLAVKDRKAVPVKWLVGMNKRIVLKALRPLKKDKKKDKVDLEADCVENGVCRALDK